MMVNWIVRQKKPYLKSWSKRKKMMLKMMGSDELLESMSQDQGSS